MLPQKIHRYIFLFGACSLAFGMMMGAVPTSLPQFILLGNWLIEGNFNAKWQRLKTNRIFWAVIGVFWIHVIGLAYTQNMQAGFADIRIKVPIFFLALVFFSTPVSRKEFYGVLGCFLLGCVCNTAWCLLYSFVLHTNNVVRDASRFMSHIRLGLYLNMAVACCVYFFMQGKRLALKFGLVILAVYYVAMMLVLGLASGLVNLFILSGIGLCVIIYSQPLKVKLVPLIILIIAGFVIMRYVSGIQKEQFTLNPGTQNTLLKQTETGREYIYLDTLSKQKENGNYVWINIQLDELKREWNREFPADSFSFKPAEHNVQRFNVLLRYLASKGLNKDSAGVAQLTTEDKRNIQKNITNYRYAGWSYLHKRTYELIYEYDEFANHRNINGHSLTMRLYFWQAALHVIRHNFIAGVGTGDVQDALNTAYADIHSPLHEEWHKRPHNQFLTVLVALGLIGFFVLAYGIIYPIIRLKKFLPFLFWPFLIITLLSFVLEDTLESQAGLTFYAFFNILFLAMACSNAKYTGEKNNHIETEKA